jgi:hypothetical protein
MSYYTHIKKAQMAKLGVKVVAEDVNPITFTPIQPKNVAPVQAYSRKPTSLWTPLPGQGNFGKAASTPAAVTAPTNAFGFPDTRRVTSTGPIEPAPTSSKRPSRFAPFLPGSEKAAIVADQWKKATISADDLPDWVDPKIAEASAAAEATKKAAKDAVVAAKAETSSSTKTVSGSLKSASSKDSPEIARIKYIQRTLGVKVDGIWGPKSAAALETMKKTQISLGFAGKDVDGIRGTKTNTAMAARDKEAVRQATSIKALATSDRSKDPMVFAREPKTNREMRQDKRAFRRTQREIDKAPDEFDFKRKGGIFYCSSK